MSFDELDRLDDYIDLDATYDEYEEDPADKEELSEEECLLHYGMPRRSGRYPYGSGKDPYQHSEAFAGRVQQLRKEGMSEKDIARAMGCQSTGDLRAQYSRAVTQLRADRIARASSMKSRGMTNAQIAREMGINESTLRSLLNQKSEARMKAAENVAQFLKEQVDKLGMVDVGTGVERELNISKEKMKVALQLLEKEGYGNYNGSVHQATNPGQRTIIRVLCPPDIKPAPGKKSPPDIYDFEKIHSLRDYISREDEQGNEHFEKKFEYPASLDSSRLKIRYRDEKAPDGHTGVEKDGTVEIRRGVKDLDLGESRYAQVRILVDGTHYIKGMARYADDLPDGVDVVFNTNKTPDQAEKVLKPIKTDDPANPFGSSLRQEGGQYHYTDENGERKLGLINKTRQEGDWGEWADNLPAQFLAKQPMHLINKQLGLARQDKQLELEDIMSLTNPTVKKHLLETFANDCDSASVHLKAAALPRQKYQVILPVSTMKDDEIYAPRYQDGETVALIRYPHGGTFEIPILKVNNKQPDGKRIIGPTALDAVGINANVAERLSGADFDGDTVMVIPCNSAFSQVKIQSRLKGGVNLPPSMKDLEGFDPKLAYPETEGMKYMKYKVRDKNGREREVDHTQMQMGMISNLITDMTLRGAPDAELVRAIKHSMVVIDAGKHKLDYKRSEEENGIAALKKRWQSYVDENGKMHEGGASTLISRAKSPVQVLKRRGQPKINQKGKSWYDPDKPEGALVYQEVEETFVDKHGKTRVRMQDVPRMDTVKDARMLSTGTPEENAYADYANAMKSMANKARLGMATTGKIEYSPSAKAAYRDEVERMEAQLNMAMLNAPRERQAQLAANSEVQAMVKANPGMSREEKKKAGQQALSRARLRFDAHRRPVEITPRAWQAIQAGAVTETKLKEILRFADIDQVRAYATPKTMKTLTPGKQARIRALQASGYTTAQIANALGVSASTVSNFLSGKEE